jgi:hypothetical protein
MVSGEKDELYQATTLKEAMNWLAVSNPLKFLRALISAKGESRLDDAHLRMKAKGMAKDYQALFGGLAKEFNVTLVAGSIVLPEPSLSVKCTPSSMNMRSSPLMASIPSAWSTPRPDAWAS